ncbi:unnamed protein product [Sphenostylis stenocarpa]|uniref:Uncharacterized protein n=1 Tax=Sphenostylis stenocarpa TaxID=92480 RepID=A0AA86W6A0_9FABA|nr:unnamed protein product [Sphenostylis stenocarpa]
MGDKSGTEAVPSTTRTTCLIKKPGQVGNDKMKEKRNRREGHINACTHAFVLCNEWSHRGASIGSTCKKKRKPTNVFIFNNALEMVQI